MVTYITNEQKNVLCSIAAAIKTLNFKENTDAEVYDLKRNIEYDVSLLNELGVSNKIRATIFSQCESRDSLDMYFSDILKNNNIIVKD